MIVKNVLFFCFFTYFCTCLADKYELIDVDPMCQLRRGEYFFYLSYTFAIFYSYFDNRLK